jgi:hypothetical protein
MHLRVAMLVSKRREGAGDRHFQRRDECRSSGYPLAVPLITQR